MANKSRRRPARRNSFSVCHSGNRAHGAKQVSSLASLRGDQKLDSLIPAFVRWHWEHGIVSDVSVVLKQLTAFFAICAELDGDAKVTAIEPKDMAELVARLIERNTEFAALFCGTLIEFVNFLMDTSRWAGSRESYQALRRILYDGLFNAKFLPPPQARTEPQLAVPPAARVRDRHN